MNANRILAGEYIIALGFTSWFAIKNQYAPWPGTIAKLSASFVLFGVFAMFAPEVAAAMAGGTLLALFVKVYSSGLSSYQGGVPQPDANTFPYFPLGWGVNGDTPLKVGGK